MAFNVAAGNFALLPENLLGYQVLDGPRGRCRIDLIVYNPVRDDPLYVPFLDIDPQKAPPGPYGSL